MQMTSYNAYEVFSKSVVIISGMNSNTKYNKFLSYGFFFAHEKFKREEIQD